MKTCFLDTETTGLAGTDEIVEIAICDENGEEILNSLVKPKNTLVWPWAQKVHGISPKDVDSAPSLIELLPSIRAAFSGRKVIIYNASFDVRFFPRDTFDNCEIECCMLAYSRQIKTGSRKLTSAAEHVGHIWSGSAHRAMSDARATASVWKWLVHCQKANFYTQTAQLG